MITSHSLAETFISYVQWLLTSTLFLLGLQATRILLNNHGFKSMLSCHNPTIWRFLDCLRAEKDLTDLKMTRRLIKEDPEPRRPKWIQYETQLQKILQRFNTYADPLDFLTTVGNILKICFAFT